MRSELHEQLKVPRAATHFPSLGEEADRNTNVYMFVQDAPLAVMPIGGESLQSPNFSVTIQDGTEHKTRVTTMLKSLTSTDWDDWRSLEELLSDSVEQLARNLAWHGRAIHEIIRDEANDEARLLYGFTPRRLFRIFGWYIQIVPKADRGVWEKYCIIIPEKDIWDITMPQVLGGYRGYRAILRKLARFPDPGPLLLPEELGKQGWATHYDFQHHVRETELFEAKVTARWGWDRRDYTDQNWTEFYGIYRNVTFKWAQACMREHIVKELNQLFQRLNIKAKIVMEGLPTARKILKIRKQMCEGKISLSDAFDACSI